MKRLVPLLTLVLTPALASAALLSYTDTTATQYSDNTLNTYNVSVYDGKAAWTNAQGSGAADGNGFVFGDGTVEDYALVGSGTTPYAEGSASLITWDGSSTTGASGTKDWAQVWTTTDPGTGFSTTADYAAGDTVSQGFGYAGTIDISGYVSGTIYFFHGTFSASYDDIINLSMVGSGQTPLSATSTNAGGSHVGFISTYTFSDAADYDTISYEYLNTDTEVSPGSAARFGGVIFDGVAVPEPSTLALIGLGATAAVLVRRRLK